MDRAHSTLYPRQTSRPAMQIDDMRHTDSQSMASGPSVSAQQQDALSQRPERRILKSSAQFRADTRFVRDMDDIFAGRPRRLLLPTTERRGQTFLPQSLVDAAPAKWRVQAHADALTAWAQERQADLPFMWNIAKGATGVTLILVYSTAFAGAPIRFAGCVLGNQDINCPDWSFLRGGLIGLIVGVDPKILSSGASMLYTYAWSTLAMYVGYKLFSSAISGY